MLVVDGAGYLPRGSSSRRSSFFGFANQFSLIAFFVDILDTETGAVYKYDSPVQSYDVVSLLHQFKPYGFVEIKAGASTGYLIHPITKYDLQFLEYVESVERVYDLVVDSEWLVPNVELVKKEYGDRLVSRQIYIERLDAFSTLFRMSGPATGTFTLLTGCSSKRAVWVDGACYIVSRCTLSASDGRLKKKEVESYKVTFNDVDKAKVLIGKVCALRGPETRRFFVDE